MIKSIVDLMELERSYRCYLSAHNVEFDDKGYPRFLPSMFIDQWPDAIVTFQCRNNAMLVKNPVRTAICFFTTDYRLYPRLERIFDDLDEYKKFMAVISMDLTFTDDMDPELQQLIVTINLLFTMILAVNGIKIILNTRSGSLTSSQIFGSIPKGIMVSSGFLGCKRIEEGNLSYITKMLFLFPSKVIIYGKHDQHAEKQLDRLGFEYRVYPDVHKITKNKENEYGR